MAFATGLTDFHAHVLPGADHGSDSEHTSITQLKLLQSAGAESVVATPHFYPNEISVSRFLKKRTESALRLQKAVGVQELPEIYIGAEVLVCPHIDSMPDLASLCIAGTQTILLEMPFGKWSEDLYETVYGISRSGLVPVMAHADRYSLSQVQRLIFDTGVRVQLNADCFTRFFAARGAKKLLSDGSVAAVGSDIHGADRRCAKLFQDFFKRTEENRERICESSISLLRGALPLDKFLSDKQTLKGDC